MPTVVRTLLTAGLLCVAGTILIGTGIAVGINGIIAGTAVLGDPSHLRFTESVWHYITGMAKMLPLWMVPILIGSGVSWVGVKLLNRGRRVWLWR